MSEKVTRIDVAYAVTRKGYSPAMTTVVLVEGQTTVDDIPAIIALRRGVHASEIRVIATQELDD